MRLILVWLINTVSLIAVAYLMPSISVANFTTALVAALVLGLVNTVIRPILVLLNACNLVGHRHRGARLDTLKLEIYKRTAARLAEDEQDHHRTPEQARQPPGKPVGYIEQVRYPGAANERLPAA
jgi:hypothetical protein